ncbi:MAG: hypothetical protein HY048_06295 [Acidobacteria bacterium]|nr:hypothetical protein [Acidobacteriota bacterium]
MGFNLATYTAVHVVLSLVGIGSGLVVVFGFLTARQSDAWTALFLRTTIATSLTGFGFPVDHLMPSHIIGGISLALLAVAVYARYQARLEGVWRRTYVVCVVIALYLNVFVLVVQSFRRVPALKELAPTQSEPPFLIAQGAVLVLFVALGTFATRGRTLD